MPLFCTLEKRFRPDVIFEIFRRKFADSRYSFVRNSLEYIDTELPIANGSAMPDDSRNGVFWRNSVENIVRERDCSDP